MEKSMVIASRTADAFFNLLFIIVLSTSPASPILTEIEYHSSHNTDQDQTDHQNRKCDLKYLVS